MKRYRYFKVFTDNDDCAFFDVHDHIIDISTETGEKFVDYQERFFSERLKNLVEALDENHLIRFQKVAFSDGIDRGYYAITGLPVVNCVNLERCGKVNYRINGGDLVQAVSAQDKEVIVQYLTALPDCMIAEADDKYFLHDASPIQFTMSDDCLIGKKLKKCGSPLFTVTGNYSEIYCTDIFVRECRRNKIKGLWFLGVPCEESGGEPDGFITLSPKYIPKKLSVPETDGQLRSHFLVWIKSVAEAARSKCFKSILFGIFSSDHGYRVYAAGATEKGYDWGNDGSEAFDYFPESFDQTLSTGEMLAFVNNALVQCAVALKGYSVSFGFDEGDIYRAKR